MIERRTWLLSCASLALTGLPRIARAQAAPVVRIATSPAESYAQPFFAQSAGLFSAAGIDAQVSLLGTGAAVEAALAGGAIDVGVGTIVSIASAIERGIPFVMIAPGQLTTPQRPTAPLCVAPSSPIRTAKDLEGKTVAVPALKQIVDVALFAWMAKNGADWRSVQLVEVPFPQMGPGIQNGRFDAAMIAEPSLTNALSLGLVRVLTNPFLAIGPVFTAAGWITTKSYMQRNPEVVRKVGEALMKAGAWANTHHDQTAEIVSRITKIKLETILHEPRPVYAESMRSANLQIQLDAALKFGLIDKPLAARELLG